MRGDFDVDLQQLKFPIVGSWNWNHQEGGGGAGAANRQKRGEKNQKEAGSNHPMRLRTIKNAFLNRGNVSNQNHL